jgi:tyrosine-protein kinase Etk/Wzc
MESSNTDASPKVLTIKDYLSLFLSHKKQILTITFAVAILSAIVAFFILKPVFLSTGTLKTATSKSSMLGGLLSSTGLAELGDFGDMAPGGGSSAQELALFENIITSRRCLEETILKYKIMEEENFKFMFDALKHFRENILVLNKDKVAGTLTVGVFDTDPTKAKDMTDFLISQLNKINIELNVQNARNNRTYIEERYRIVQADLRQAEDSLQDYQNNYGVAPDIQIQVAAKGGLELEAEIKSEEVKLEILKKILSPDQAEITAQEDKINAMKRELETVNTSEYSQGKLNLKGSPKIIMDYYRLRRNVEIQNKILTTLIPILEQSKIEENKETPTVLVLDPPFVPDKKSKPKRLYIIAFCTFAAFVLSYLYFYVKDVLSKKYAALR